MSGGAHLLNGKNGRRIREAVRRTASAAEPSIPVTNERRAGPYPAPFTSVIRQVVADFAAGSPKPWREETKGILAAKLEHALHRASIRMLVEVQRQAFIEGVKWPCPDEPSDVEMERAAAEHFPHQSLTTPRELRDPHHANLHWRYVPNRGGVMRFETRHFLNGDWVADTGKERPTPKRVAMWADLIQQPTVEMRDNAPDSQYGHYDCGCMDNGVTVFLCDRHCVASRLA